MSFYNTYLMTTLCHFTIHILNDIMTIVSFYNTYLMTIMSFYNTYLMTILCHFTMHI